MDRDPPPSGQIRTERALPDFPRRYRHPLPRQWRSHLLPSERWHAKLLNTVSINDWSTMRTVAGTRSDVLPKPRRKHARNNPEKWCPRCENWKPRTLDHFYRRKDGYWQGYCILCATTETPRMRSHVARVREMKDGQTCMDCGQRFPFYVLDYDHRPGEVKRFEIGKVKRGNYTWDTILAEIAKCDLICANCHRERTWLRATADSS